MYGIRWRWRRTGMGMSPGVRLVRTEASDLAYIPFAFRLLCVLRYYYGEMRKLSAGGLRIEVHSGRISKGCSQKTSGRSYSLKHPVARHFVCLLHSKPNAFPKSLIRRGEWFLCPCRNCAASGKNYFGTPRQKEGHEAC